MRSVLMMVLAGLIMTGAALAEEKPSEKRPAEKPPAKVNVARVTEKDTAERKGMIGVLYFDRYGDISTEVAGMVKEIHFGEGDRVKRGDVLVRLNTDFLDREVAREVAQIARVSLRIEQAGRNLARFEELFREEAASETDFEDLSFSHRELIKERESLAIGLSIIRLRKKKSEIRAPFSGLIMQKSVDLGGWIDKGGTICRLGALAELFVQVPVSERLLKLLKRGDLLDVTVNAFDRKVKGEVVGVKPKADEKTKNVFLKLRLPRMDNLVENMSVTVQVPTRKGELLKIIPRDAMVKLKGKDFVYTVKDGKAMILPLDIVAYNGANVAVGGDHMKVGMPVVVDGNERLRPGQAVQITGER